MELELHLEFPTSPDSRCIDHPDTNKNPEPMPGAYHRRSVGTSDHRQALAYLSSIGSTFESSAGPTYFVSGR